MTDPVAAFAHTADTSAETTLSAYPPVWRPLLLRVHGKIPVDRSWNREAVRRFEAGEPRDLADLSRHVAGGGNLGLAIPAGVLALDADDPRSTTWLDNALPHAPMQETARGAHFLLRVPPGIEIPNAAGVEIVEGVRVDVRSGGRGQLVVEPSTHDSGFSYTWRRPLPDSIAELPECPPLILEAMRGAGSRSGAPDLCGNRTGKIEKGQRNDFLYRRACGMRRRGASDAEIAAALPVVNAERCDPPLSTAEVARTVESACRYGPGRVTERPLRTLQSEPRQDEAKERPKRSRILTAKEFLSDKSPAAIVVTLLFLAASHLLTGASKAGKTWLALQLVMAAATGHEFLGLVTERVKVLLISLELSAGVVRERLERIHEDVGVPMPRINEDLFVVAPTRDYSPTMNLLSEEGREDLRRHIRETGAQLVVLDTLYRFLPGADPNDNGAMGEVFGDINTLARESGAAIVLLDHVRKGDQPGTVSQSALGAQIKGGASNVILGLRRVSVQNGGAWELKVESHFGSWDEAITYQRPMRSDGTYGSGAIRWSATEARGLDFQQLRDLFVDHGERDQQGRPVFASLRKLRDALQASKIVPEGSNSMAEDLIHAITREHCAPADAVGTDWKDSRPIWTSTGPRNARIFTWRMSE